MRSKEIVAQARVYERLDGASPANALLSVLIDLFTAEDGDPELDPRAVQQAWERLTRELPVPEWLTESQVFSDGIDVLAANLVEAERHDLALALRSLSQPRFEGAVRSPELELGRLRQLDDLPEPTADDRLWVPRPAAGQWAVGSGQSG